MKHVHKYESAIVGEAIPLNRAIERELTRLWKAAACEGKEEPQRALLKACSLNLIIYNSHHESAENIFDLVDPVVSHYPIRAIIIEEARKRHEPRMDSWISTYCKQVTPHKQICCEQIMLRASDNLVRLVPGLVASLCVPGLPVFLWWRGEPPFESEPFLNLLELSDRALIDLSKYRDPQAELWRFIEFVTARSFKPPIIDLNWARVTWWRHLIAQFFDPPRFRPYLQRINKVVIEYAENSHAGRSNPIQALFMAGWLSNQLIWKPAKEVFRKAGSNITLHMTRADRDIIIELRPVISQFTSRGGLVRLTLLEEDEKASTQFSISRTKDAFWALTSIALPDANRIQRSVRADQSTDPELVGKELQIRTRDLTFEGMLKICQLIGT